MNSLVATHWDNNLRQTSNPTTPSVNPGVSINGTPDIIALGIESIGGTSSCAGGIGIRQLI